MAFREFQFQSCRERGLGKVDVTYVWLYTLLPLSWAANILAERMVPRFAAHTRSVRAFSVITVTYMYYVFCFSQQCIGILGTEAHNVEQVLEM